MLRGGGGGCPALARARLPRVGTIQAPAPACLQPLLRAVSKGASRTRFRIIEGASGVLRPGVFTILLG